MSAERKNLTLEPLPGYYPVVGRALAAMEECRGRLLEVLEGVADEALSTAVPGTPNSIGSLLYHIAAIELDWLFVEILEEPFPEAVMALFPYEVREEGGRLTAVPPAPLAEHLDRLARVRALMLERLKPMDAADFDRPRTFEPYDVTPAYVLHHLLQHESEHRQEIALLRWMIAAA